MFALIDCNNFYASCERIFNPKLNGKPLVILSNNDGCVIARSNEAKAIGIPMGAPAHLYAKIFDQFEVEVLSCNFSLYGDISNRLGEILKTFSPKIETYSIDESFLFLDSDNKDTLMKCGSSMIKKIYETLSLPVSVGIANSKTLSKIANKWAKKNYELSEGVKVLISEDEIDSILKTISVDEVWGIGRRIKNKLNREGIYSALDFKECPNIWIRSLLGVMGSRTQLELRGVSAISLEETRENKKSIVSSRSFRVGVRDFNYLAEAVSSFTAKALEKLRKDGSLAKTIGVTIFTDPFSLSENFYINSAYRKLEVPSKYTPLFIENAINALEDIFIPGLMYKKAIVHLSSIISEIDSPYSIFRNENKKEEVLMKIIDEINRDKGRELIRFGVEGFAQPWKSRLKNTSPAYLSKWSELLVIR